MIMLQVKTEKLDEMQTELIAASHSQHASDAQTEQIKQLSQLLESAKAPCQ